MDRIRFLKIQQATQEILKDIGPESVIVGVGRSPTALMAILASIIPRQTFTVPISYFRKLRGDFSQSEITELNNRFQVFLPPPDELLGKKILVLDYSQSGASLDAFINHLQSCLTNHGVNT